LACTMYLLQHLFKLVRSASWYAGVAGMPGAAGTPCQLVPGACLQVMPGRSLLPACQLVPACCQLVPQCPVLLILPSRGN
jgi:hypothetical protein